MAKRPLSGKQIISILIHHYGFQIVSQRGSHIKLRNNSHTTVVPNHKEVAFGTLRSVLKLAGINEKDFWTKV